MDGQGLDERLRKGALKLAAGLVFAGALIGGATAYVVSHSSGHNPSAARAGTHFPQGSQRIEIFNSERLTYQGVVAPNTKIHQTADGHLHFNDLCKGGDAVDVEGGAATLTLDDLTCPAQPAP